MSGARSRRRNPYRSGTAIYDKLREAELKRRGALAKATAARAKSPEARERARQRERATRRPLREIEKRDEYRSHLNEQDRRAFDRLTIGRQRQLIELQREYPDSIPRDLPDPFVGRYRDISWRLSYATRAGIRQKRTA